MAEVVGSLDLPLAVRGSEGLYLRDGPLLQSANTVDGCSGCRVMAFSPNGSQLAWCNGESVQVLDVATQVTKYTVSKPRTRHMTFSPLGTYLCLWEPYAIRTGEQSGQPNLEIWKEGGGGGHGEKVVDYIQKKTQSWCPQWSQDECIGARNVSNEIHFFDGGTLGKHIDRKLLLPNLELFAISPGKPPYNIAVYVPGTKGAPSFVRLYEYPRLDPAAMVASKSFYRADTVKFHWNKKGSAVLVLTTTEVDKTGASYYGEQGLHYLSTRGEGNIVILGKKGPVYEVEWSPDSSEFCVVYGFMPSKATLFNCKCEAVFDFGTGHRNLASFNPHGNILCLAGFGNLRGNMEFWDRKNLKLISKAQASDSTTFQWSPDGSHVVTATTAPRLREGNGFKVWHFSGSLMTQHDTPPKHELWEVGWQPRSVEQFPPPDVLARPASGTQQPQPQAKPAGAYRPPGLRGKPYTFKLHEEEPPQGVGASADKTGTEKLSKSAQKNKRKRESKQKAKDECTVSSGGGGPPTRNEEQKAALETASYVMNRAVGGASRVAPTSGSGQRGGSGNEPTMEQDKKLKNLRKKLRQIEQLKQQQSEGKELEANQVEKIKGEQAILDEIAKLELS